MFGLSRSWAEPETTWQSSVSLHLVKDRNQEDQFLSNLCGFFDIFLACFGPVFSSTLKLTEIFAFTSKQCQVMDISDEDDAGPWAEGEKKAKWEDHRFGLSNLDVFASKALNSSFASKQGFILWRSIPFLHLFSSWFVNFCDSCFGLSWLQGFEDRIYWEGMGSVLLCHGRDHCTSRYKKSWDVPTKGQLMTLMMSKQVPASLTLCTSKLLHGTIWICY